MRGGSSRQTMPVQIRKRWCLRPVLAGDGCDGEVCFIVSSLISAMAERLAGAICQVCCLDANIVFSSTRPNHRDRGYSVPHGEPFRQWHTFSGVAYPQVVILRSAMAPYAHIPRCGYCRGMQNGVTLHPQSDAWTRRGKSMQGSARWSVMRSGPPPFPMRNKQISLILKPISLRQ